MTQPTAAIIQRLKPKYVLHYDIVLKKDRMQVTLNKRRKLCPKKGKSY